MSGPAGFAHLHVASSYSMRYGTASPAALAARARELGMPALALTDRDGLYGAVKHAAACRQAEISPILGTDLALRAAPGAPGGPGTRSSRSSRRRPRACPASPAAVPPRLANETAARVTLLALGEGGGPGESPAPGWASLCRLVSAAHQSGERGVPAVTPDLVADHADGLVVLLGPASDVGHAIAARRPDRAAAALARWRERAETVIEIVDHHGLGDTGNAVRMLRLAREAGVPAVLTNAARYLEPADAPVAQVLDAARQLVPLGRRHLADHNAQAHLKDSEQMARVAARICGPGRCPGLRSSRGLRSCSGRCGDPAHQLLADTAALARQCSLSQADDLGLGRMHLPETSGGDALAQLRQRCQAGMARRGLDGDHAAAKRLDHELGIIARAGLASYFLTVADVAALISGRGIRCAIRGSGAGCLVNYLIGISGINPLEHDLIMERFLSEGRKGLPDIDLDVESARRIEAYRAIIERYGEERCGCVSMMETYRARSAIRDAAGALGLPPYEIDAIAKAFGHIRARGISRALADLPELRASNLAIPQLTSLFRIAERLDGLPRHIAMHPCGVVLSSATLLDRVPVERSADGLPLCQFDMDDVEAAGMIKLDVLGVRMQSAMAYALDEIERTRGERVDIDAISQDDKPTFEMISSGRTIGCFQIESPGQRELVTRLAPRGLGDLLVDISLFRPGPVNSDMITPYLDIKHHRRPPCYPHEDLAESLGETGGVVIFHEQVLRVIDAMTGCGLSEAERRRRQLSDESARSDVRTWFCGAARARGYDHTIVTRVWEVLEAFGAFGFCKAHAAAFAIPTYQSAWLKRHYPAAFYAGVLTHDPGMYPKRVITGDARLAGIRVLPVDVNASAGDWRAETPESLRAGLREVKGISDAEVARIIAGRPYASLRDFWRRARVSRPVAERLVLVGALDSLYAGPGPQPTRRDLLARVGVLAGPARPVRTRSVPAHAALAISSGGSTEHGPGQPASGPGQPVAGPDQLAPALGQVAPGPGQAAPGQTAPGQTAPGQPGSGQAAPGQAAPGQPGSGQAAPGQAVPGQPGPGLGQPVLGPDQLALGPDSGGRGDNGDGLARIVPVGELPELSAAERVEAELEILGIDVSRHVISFYEETLRALGVVRAAHLHRCRSGTSVLVAGVKTSTQTPAVRSGQRVIFATLDDATGQMNLAFFESVQERCAARLFGSWLLVVRGRVRRPGRRNTPDQEGRAVSVNATECWDLAVLEEIRLSRGIRAARAAMAAGDVPGPGVAAAARGAVRPAARDRPANGTVIYPTGFTLSPYAETGSSGGAMKDPPRKLWHASPGSSGGWISG
jgi:error-prone DNA polymerase